MCGKAMLNCTVGIFAPRDSNMGQSSLASVVENLVPVTSVVNPAKRQVREILGTMLVKETSRPSSNCYYDVSQLKNISCLPQTSHRVAMR